MRLRARRQGRRRRCGAQGRAHAAVMLALALAAAPLARAQTIQPSVSITPTVVRIGERVVYRGRIPFDHWGARYKWLPPDSSADLAWSGVRPSMRYGHPPARPSPRLPARVGTLDTLVIEATLQAFRPGTLSIPGLRFQSQDPRRPAIYRLPTTTLVVVPVVPADSAADLRPLRGPMAAPWWERVPWRWVILGVLVIAAIVALVIRLRRRRAKPVPAPVPALDPATAALAELEALRGRNLPAHGRFAEHAFHLSRILRRFLEATLHSPRPGYTTGELIDHLESTAIDRGDLEGLAGLLRVWDRVKFARASSSSDDAVRSEQAVETVIRRALPAPTKAAA